MIYNVIALVITVVWRQVSAVQVTSNRAVVTYHSTNLEHGIDVDFLIKGVYVTKVTSVINVAF